MTTQEIQEYVDAAVSLKFPGYRAESGEMVTSEGGEGRFFGKVVATMYSGLLGGRDVYLAIGKTAKGLQIVKLGNSESVKPGEVELDFMLLKEFGIEMEGGE